MTNTRRMGPGSGGAAGPPVGVTGMGCTWKGVVTASILDWMLRSAWALALPICGSVEAPTASTKTVVSESNRHEISMMLPQAPRENRTSKLDKRHGSVNP